VERSWEKAMNMQGGGYAGELVWARSAKLSATVRNRSHEAAGGAQKNNGRAGVFGGRAWTTIGRSLKLSARELQLVRGVFDDRTDFSISSTLGISQHTVHTHFERLYHKLGVGNRVQLVVRVMREFLALTASPRDALPPLCPRHAAGLCRRRPSRALSSVK
jgi:DNA-binding CsgD family transcriptional regulator